MPFPNPRGGSTCTQPNNPPHQSLDIFQPSQASKRATQNSLRDNLRVPTHLRCRVNFCDASLAKYSSADEKTDFEKSWTIFKKERKGEFLNSLQNKGLRENIMGSSLLSCTGRTKGHAMKLKEGKFHTEEREYSFTEHGRFRSLLLWGTSVERK